MNLQMYSIKITQKVNFNLLAFDEFPMNAGSVIFHL